MRPRSAAIDKNDATDREASAINVARLALDNRETLHPAHLVELLSVATWMFTEARGKYSTRFASRAATQVGATVRHEHVIPRLVLSKAMMDHPERAEDIMRLAVACIVTHEEHQRLDPREFGWNRYKSAGIRVVDTVGDEAEVDLDLLASTLAENWARVTS